MLRIILLISNRTLMSFHISKIMIPFTGYNQIIARPFNFLIIINNPDKHFKLSNLLALVILIPIKGISNKVRRIQLAILLVRKETFCTTNLTVGGALFSLIALGSNRSVTVGTTHFLCPLSGKSSLTIIIIGIHFTKSTVAWPLHRFFTIAGFGIGMWKYCEEKSFSWLLRPHVIKFRPHRIFVLFDFYF